MRYGRPLQFVLLLVFLLVPLLASTTTARAGAPPNRLDFNGGRVVANPAIHNLYMDFSWDSDNPAAISRTNIDDFTQTLTVSNYFDHALQYGVGTSSFTGSDRSNIICPSPIFEGATEFVAILLWVECMTQPNPFFPFPATLTGVPKPDGNSLYVVYVPSNTSIIEPGFSSCHDFAAYHFMGVQLAWNFAGPIPFLKPQDFPFAVVPVDCAFSNQPNPIDGLSVNATHEIIEAATDPVILQSWIDNTNSGSIKILTKGEAADICEPGAGPVPTPPVRLTIGLLVAPYWSNSENRCVPVTHTFALNEAGLPATVAHEAQFDGSTQTLPFSTIVDDATSHSYSFPTPVSDPNPGTRYVTKEPPATVDVTANFSKTAAYTTQHFLTVQAVPPVAQALDASLTVSDWHDAGSTVALNTDPLIPTSPTDRFRFDHWSGDVSSPSPHTSIVMTSPKTAIANYVPQHLLTVNTHGLGTNQTHIFNGSSLLGEANDPNPLAVFVDEGPLALNADAVVSGANGVQYFFQNFVPPPPSTLTLPFTTTASYETIAQLIDDALASGGIFGPGAQGLGNSYRQQFAAVQADIAQGNHAQALLDLQSFVAHVQAQQGKHVTPALAVTLQLDALLVFHAELCKAIVASQVSAATAAADYSFYSGLVSSLGGVVLPPC